MGSTVPGAGCIHPGVFRTALRHRQLAPLAAAQLAGIACGIIGVRWSSTVIPPALYGIFGLLLSATQAGLAVTHQGVLKHVQRAWTASTRAAPFFREIAGASRLPTVWLALAMIPVVFVLHVAGEVPLTLSVFVWLVAANIGAVGTAVLQFALQAEQRYWPYFGASAVGSAFRSFAPPLFAVLLGASLGVLLSAWVLFIGASFLVSLWALKPAWNRAGNAHAARSLSIEPMIQPLAIAGLLNWIGAIAPRWLLALSSGSDETGYFILAMNLATVIPAAVSSILVSYSFPPMFARAREGAPAGLLERMNFKDLFWMMLLAQAGIAALAWIAPYLVGPIIAVRYAPSVDWILAAGNATLAATTQQFCQNVLLACRREEGCLGLSLASFLLRLIVMLAGLALGSGAFRVSLVLLPWLTVLAEVAFTHRLLQAPAKVPPPAAAPPPGL